MEPPWERQLWRDKLSRALVQDHCYLGDDNCDTACDIHAAWKGGYVLWAAHLLMGATECPHVEAFFDPRAGPYGVEVPWAAIDAERDAFVENTPHIACGDCNATNWDVKYGDRCGACGKPLLKASPGFLDPDTETWCKDCYDGCKYGAYVMHALGRKCLRHEMKHMPPGVQYTCFECRDVCLSQQWSLAEAVAESEGVP